MYEVFVQVLTIARGMWRYRWYSIGTAYLVCLIGWVYVNQMPDRYVSSANVYLDTQSVLAPLLEGLAVDTDVRTKVDMLTKGLTSRPSIERVIRETDLDLRARNDKEMEDLITGVSRKVSVTRPMNSYMYTLSYSDVDPVMAQKVVQTLLDSLVEQTLGSSRQDTVYAQKFLVDKISDYEARLTEAESKLAEFKKVHVGLMPGQRGGYFERLQNAQNELEESERQLRTAENRYGELKKQLRGEKAVIGNTELDARIQERQQELSSLLLKYTDEHPDVVALRATIKQLQERKQNADGWGKQLSGDEAGLNPVYQSIKIAASEAEVEVVTLRARVSDQKKLIEELGKLVDTIPEVEANLARLNRDYNVTKTQYEALLERLESAKLSEGAEKSKDEIKFRVIEPPILPLAPSEPNRLLLISLVLVVALGAGLGFAYMLNEFKPVYSTIEELSEEMDLPVLGIVSIKLDEDERVKKNTNLKYLGGALSALLLSYIIVLVVA